ncbi:MAG: B3/4 domain-containing protein [Actinomycetota bacterium]
MNEYMDAVSVDASVQELRPDYRALIVMARGLRGGPSDPASDAFLRDAEQSAIARLGGAPPEELPEIAAWREAFLAFGVKPRVARSSVEALLRRVAAGLPRIDRLTDIYNAISISHLLPLGGEDLDRYAGPPRLVRTSGHEPFDTVADGSPVTDHPEVGEVAWRDDLGITCRRWNWRQCVRTRLTPETVNALFILDALGPISDTALQEAGDDLVGLLVADSPDTDVTTRIVGGTG